MTLVLKIRGNDARFKDILPQFLIHEIGNCFFFSFGIPSFSSQQWSTVDRWMLSYRYCLSLQHWLGSMKPLFNFEMRENREIISPEGIQLMTGVSATVNINISSLFLTCCVINHFEMFLIFKKPGWRSLLFSGHLVGDIVSIVSESSQAILVVLANCCLHSPRLTYEFSSESFSFLVLLPTFERPSFTLIWATWKSF